MEESIVLLFNRIIGDMEIDVLLFNRPIGDNKILLRRIVCI